MTAYRHEPARVEIVTAHPHEPTRLEITPAGRLTPARRQPPPGGGRTQSRGQSRGQAQASNLSARFREQYAKAQTEQERYWAAHRYFTAAAAAGRTSPGSTAHGTAAAHGIARDVVLTLIRAGDTLTAHLATPRTHATPRTQSRRHARANLLTTRVREEYASALTEPERIGAAHRYFTAAAAALRRPDQATTDAITRDVVRTLIHAGDTLTTHLATPRPRGSVRRPRSEEPR